MGVHADLKEQDHACAQEAVGAALHVLAVCDVETEASAAEACTDGQEVFVSFGIVGGDVTETATQREGLDHDFDAAPCVMACLASFQIRAIFAEESKDAEDTCEACADVTRVHQIAFL